MVLFLGFGAVSLMLVFGCLFLIVWLCIIFCLCSFFLRRVEESARF